MKRELKQCPPRKPVSKPREKQKPLTRAAAAGSNGDGVATICVPEPLSISSGPGERRREGRLSPSF
jgi:hypothetical protein